MCGTHSIDKSTVKNSKEAHLETLAALDRLKALALLAWAPSSLPEPTAHSSAARSCEQAAGQRGC